MAIVTSDVAQTERIRAVNNALASLRLEGLEPSDEAKTIGQRYVDGELTLDEMSKAILALLDREYGPVHLSGD